MNFISSPDDHELLHRLRMGDEEAFTEIYNRYWKPLFVQAAHKLKSFAQAEEVVQDIFLAVWKRRAELHITSGLSAYLAVCVKYKVINALARRSRDEQYTQHAIYTAAAASYSPEEWIRFEELKAQLAQQTARLPEKCRLVFQLSREQGLSHREIAAELNISEKTVEAHLSKALRTLRSSLGQVFFFLYL